MGLLEVAPLLLNHSVHRKDFHSKEGLLGAKDRKQRLGVRNDFLLFFASTI
jgi:ribosomal protein S15P/S13E